MLTDSLTPTATVAISLTNLLLTTTADSKIYASANSTCSKFESFVTSTKTPDKNSIETAGTGVEEKKDDVAGGDEDEAQNLPQQYTITFNHEVTSSLFDVNSAACTNFVGSKLDISFFQQTGDAQNQEVDALLGSCSVSFDSLISGSTNISLTVPIDKPKVEESEEEEKKEEDEQKSDIQANEADENKQLNDDFDDVAQPEEDVKPDSVVIQFTAGSELADFAVGGTIISFNGGSVSNCPSSFGVKVEDDCELENYETRLNELLAEEKKKFSYQLIFDSCGDVVFGNVLANGALSWEKEEEEDNKEEGGEDGADIELGREKSEEEAKGGEEEKGENEAEPSAPKPKPISGLFNLTFEDDSNGIFLSRYDVRVLKSSIRDEKNLVFSLKRATNNAASEDDAADKKDKKDKKGKKNKGEEKTEEASGKTGNDDAFVDTVSVSLDQLLDAGSTTADLIGSLSTSEDTFVSATIILSSAISRGARAEEAVGSNSTPPPPVVAPYHCEPFVKYEKKLTRDMYKELADQLDSSIETLVEHWASLFMLNESKCADYSQEEKMKRLLYHLNKNGGYYEVKEALKPCLQRIVAVRDGKAPNLKTAEGNFYVGELFEFLLGEVNKSLNRKFVPESVIESRESIKNDIKQASNIPDKIVKLKMLAEDAEGNENFAYAERLYRSQVEMSKVETRNERMGWRILQKACSDFAEFSLCRWDVASEGKLAAARESLENALTLCGTDSSNKLLLSAIYLEQGENEFASITLKEMLVQNLPEDEENDGYTSDAMAAESGDNGTLLNVLSALLANSLGDSQKRRQSLRYAGLSALDKGSSTNEGRHVVTAVLEAADYLLSYSLTKTANQCLKWADEYIESNRNKCIEIGAPTMTPMNIRRRLTSTRAKYFLAAGDLESAHKAALEAEQRNKGHFNAGATALVLAEVLLKLGRKEEALTKYLSLLKLLEKPIPFRVYCTAAKLLIEFERYDEAREVCFQAADTWRYSSVWLRIGSTSIKLGFLEDAEDALQEANGADTHNSLVWGYFCLVCLRAKVGDRLREANDALSQALRLELDDSEIIVELGEEFTLIDQLPQAEALFRRGVNLGIGHPGEFNFKLGSNLASQNEYEGALEQFALGEEAGGEWGERCSDSASALKAKIGRV